MVKFNPKTPSRVVTKSPFTKLSVNSSLGVMVIASKALFETKLENPRTASKYVYVTPEDSKIPVRKTATDIAYDVIKKIKSEGYTLFIDDNRVPNERDAKNPGTCIVARSVEHAKEVVEKLGCPEHLHLDFSLDSFTTGETIMPFLDWFVEKYSKEPTLVPEKFNHTVMSQHEQGPMLINRKMVELYDIIWN